MHYSRPMVVIMLLSVCYTSQASSAHNICDKQFKRANVSADETVPLEEYRKKQVQENFNRIDTDRNGALTRAEFTVRQVSDRGYKREEVDALNAQVIRMDRNMDGFLQASEYGGLMAEGTVYGPPPNFSEVARNGRIDYCELSTSLGLHHARQNFSGRDTNKDNVISFKEYVAHADITNAVKRQQDATDGAITLEECLERESNQGLPSTCCDN